MKMILTNIHGIIDFSFEYENNLDRKIDHRERQKFSRHYGENAVNIGQNYFRNEDLSEAKALRILPEPRPTEQKQANGVPN